MPRFVAVATTEVGLEEDDRAWLVDNGQLDVFLDVAQQISCGGAVGNMGVFYVRDRDGDTYWMDSAYTPAHDETIVRTVAVRLEETKYVGHHGIR